MYAIRDLLEIDNEGPQGANVRLALIDSGVDFSHPDLEAACARADAKSFLVSDDLGDEDGHGSHLAGIIAGSGACDAAFAGVAPCCSVLSFRVHRKGKQFDTDNAAAAVLQAVKDGADILNLSSGVAPGLDAPWIWSNEFTDLEKAIIYASAKGVLCVVAAGNSGPSRGSISVPGGLPAALTVGAVEWDGSVSEHSSRGPFRRSPTMRRRTERYCTMSGHFTHKGKVEVAKPDLVCFGEEIGSCRAEQSDFGNPGERYVTLGGSSQATAAVSSLAARALSHLRLAEADLGSKPGQTLRSLLISSAERTKDQDHMDYGYGLLRWPKLKQHIELFLSDREYAATIRQMEPVFVVSSHVSPEAPQDGTASADVVPESGQAQ